VFTNVEKDITMLGKRGTSMKKTNEYSKFKLLGYNRRVDVNHVAMLKKKILISNELHVNPIQVTKDLEIINGQHRFTAAKELNVPIYYEIVDPFVPTSILHSNYAKSWNIEDYIHYYAATGREEHKKVIELCHKYGLPISACLMLLGTYIRGKQLEEFTIKEGRLFLFHKTMQFRNQLIKDAPHSDNLFRSTVRNAKFLEIILQIIDSNKFDLTRLHKMLIKQHFKVRGRARKCDYIELIMEIYNYGLSHKVML